MKRLGLYGGSFDPIHVGHITPVEDARARMGLDAVIYVPAYRAPHKPDGPEVSAWHRFAMAALALAPHERLQLSDYEVSRAERVYTVDTLAAFRNAHPEDEVVLLVGSDSLAALPTWRRWEEIVARHRLVVVVREPYDRPRVEAELPPPLRARLAPAGATLREDRPETILWGGNTPVTMSSTWLRDALPAGEKLNGGLPAPVEAYVRRHGLYGVSLP